MAELFASGRFVDVVIAFMVIEALVLLVLRGRFGGRIGTVDIALLLLPGLCLLLAMRAALTGSWVAVAAWLVAALLAHLADLWRRFRRQ